MFATSGIRLDELANMKFHDVDFDRETVTVHSETAKNHRSREIPLDDEGPLATIRQLQREAPYRKPVRGRTRSGRYRGRTPQWQPRHPLAPWDVCHIGAGAYRGSAVRPRDPGIFDPGDDHADLREEHRPWQAVAAFPFTTVSTPAHIVSLESVSTREAISAGNSLQVKISL